MDGNVATGEALPDCTMTPGDGPLACREALVGPALATGLEAHSRGP